MEAVASGHVSTPNRVGHPPARGRGDAQRAAGAEQLAAGIGLREAPALLLRRAPRRSEAAARAMGHVEWRAAPRCMKALASDGVSSPIPPIRPPPAAATQNARLAPERAAGIKRRETPATLLRSGPPRSDAAGLAMGLRRVAGRRRWCIVEGATPARSAHRAQPTGRTHPAPAARAWSSLRAARIAHP